MRVEGSPPRECTNGTRAGSSLQLPATRWSTTLSPKVNLPHGINFRALSGANLAKLPPGMKGERNHENARMEHGQDRRCNRLTTRWSTTLSPKVNLPHGINFRALSGANLVTLPPGIKGERYDEPHENARMQHGQDRRCNCLYRGHKVYEPQIENCAAGQPRLTCVRGLDVIRKEAWPFYRTISGVRLCWELEEPKGPKGLHEWNTGRIVVAIAWCARWGGSRREREFFIANLLVRIH